MFENLRKNFLKGATDALGIAISIALMLVLPLALSAVALWVLWQFHGLNLTFGFGVIFFASTIIGFLLQVGVSDFLDRMVEMYVQRKALAVVVDFILGVLIFQLAYAFILPGMQSLYAAVYVVVIEVVLMLLFDLDSIS
ncbi:hypothetical protein BSR28_05040 [Boudabousia liubingyangii]|uniref:hypothetical protein n=1 Tax=Boudabousia liubingyangii TaxID=1921764 RepID=UPI00093F2E43|nr:hypothetical protein [Boudabousia liubingyangii]OKL46806.1 hypothetical protein BSR28_05040 [Boudabousia liubingyangii]